MIMTYTILCSYRFIDLDGPLHLSEDPVVRGYEGKIMSSFTKFTLKCLKHFSLVFQIF